SLGKFWLLVPALLHHRLPEYLQRLRERKRESSDKSSTSTCAPSRRLRRGRQEHGYSVCDIVQRPRRSFCLDARFALPFRTRHACHHSCVAVVSAARLRPKLAQSPIATPRTRARIARLR